MGMPPARPELANKGPIANVAFHVHQPDRHIPSRWPQELAIRDFNPCAIARVRQPHVKEPHLSSQAAEPDAHNFPYVVEITEKRLRNNNIPNGELPGKWQRLIQAALLVRYAAGLP